MLLHSCIVMDAYWTDGQYSHPFKLWGKGISVRDLCYIYSTDIDYLSYIKSIPSMSSLFIQFSNYDHA